MTYHFDILNPKVFTFVDELQRVKNTNNYFRFFEVFRDRPITLSDIQGLYNEREQLYKLTNELAAEVSRFYDAARKFAAENDDLKKQLEALKKSIDWKG